MRRTGFGYRSHQVMQLVFCFANGYDGMVLGPKMLRMGDQNVETVSWISNIVGTLIGYLFFLSMGFVYRDVMDDRTVFGFF